MIFNKTLLFVVFSLLLSVSLALRMKAEWNGVVIAESDDIVNVEGNAYFPESTLKKEYIQQSSTTTVCGWKGQFILLVPAVVITVEE